MLKRIPATLQALPLPGFDARSARFRYGARSEAAVFVGDLLYEFAPSLRDEQLEIVAISRRPGVLSKVALRPRPGVIVPLTVGIGADPLAQVSQRLDGERIQVVRWQTSAAAYIADALGLGEVPPMRLLPAVAQAQVLLGEIDLLGMAGWRGLNVLLASALTGWRIRLEPVAATDAWRQLRIAQAAHRPVTGYLLDGTRRGLQVELLGLRAQLSAARRAETLNVGQELDVRVTRMDADEGRIFAAEWARSNDQPPLI
jgi:N utilization substance protein A